MLKVANPCWPCSASSATTIEESMPPDSSTPTGTSATIRRFTAVRSASINAASQSRPDQDALSGSRPNFGVQ
ncbi:Uncharacterised protein [Mycobacterium tuberculosis]|nr:Uncharacterised protein [Mycobacterium tuberculosis]